MGLVIVQHPAQPAARPLRTCWLWPECVPLWNAWNQLQTQWRTGGMEGQRTGLDYAAVAAWLRAHGWHHGPRRSLRMALDCIAGMEAASLAVWAEAAEQQRQRKPPAGHPHPPPRR